MLRGTAVARCAASGAGVSLYRTTWGVPNSFGLEGTDAIADLFTRITRDPATGEQLFHGVEFCAGTFFPFLGEEAAAAEALIRTRNRAIVQVHTCGYPVPPAYHLAHGQSAGVTSGRRMLQPAWKEHADSLRFHAEDMAVRLRVPAGMEEAAKAHPELASGYGGSTESKHALVACINCHSGKDSLPRDDALKFLEEACVIERDVGIPICHETHRQRLLHDPFVLRALRDDLPAGLKLNCDLAHYVVALERVMSDEHDAEFWPELLSEVIARRAYMMHCRVGLPQSPQLQDPRPAQAAFAAANGVSGYSAAPDAAARATEEESAALTAHVAWWRAIADSMRERGVPVRAVPEYGPAPYQTQGTEADLADICVDAGRFLAKVL